VSTPAASASRARVSSSTRARSVATAETSPTAVWLGESEERAIDVIGAAKAVRGESSYLGRPRRASGHTCARGHAGTATRASGPVHRAAHSGNGDHVDRDALRA